MSKTRRCRDGLEGDGVRDGDRLAADRPSCEIEALRQSVPWRMNSSQPGATYAPCVSDARRRVTSDDSSEPRYTPRTASGPPTKNRNCRPPGRNCGWRWPVDSAAGVVAASTVPPAALTRRSDGCGGAGEEDGSVRSPRGRRPGQGVGHRLRRAAPGLDAFQLAVREEPDRAAVGRPEWPARPFRARQCVRARGVEGPHPQRGLPVVVGHEREAPPVG